MQKPSLTWVLISGAARSGTTLFGRLVSAHPQAAILHEYGLGTLITRLMDLHSNPTRIVGESDPVTTDWMHSASNKGSSLDEPDELDQVEAYYASRMALANEAFGTRPAWPNAVEFNTLAKGFFETVFEKANLGVVGDKMPLQSGGQIIDPKIQLLGDIRFLLILRHPLDVVNSSAKRIKETQIGRDEWPVQSVWDACLDYVEAWRTMRALWNHPGHRVHVLKYEDLCASPNAVMASVWEFLGLTPITLPAAIEAIPEHLRGHALSEDDRVQLGDFFSEFSGWNEKTAPELLVDVSPLVKVPFDQRIDFTSVQGQLLLWSGFALPEEAWVWTLGRNAQIKLRHGHVEEGILLELWVVFAFSRPSCDCDVLIGINGGAATLHSLANVPQRLSFHVPEERLNDECSITVAITVLRPKEPYEEVSHDHRRLGLALGAIRVSPA